MAPLLFLLPVVGLGLISGLEFIGHKLRMRGLSFGAVIILFLLSLATLGLRAGRGPSYRFTVTYAAKLERELSSHIGKNDFIVADGVMRPLIDYFSPGYALGFNHLNNERAHLNDSMKKLNDSGSAVFLCDSEVIGWTKETYEEKPSRIERRNRFLESFSLTPVTTINAKDLGFVETKNVFSLITDQGDHAWSSLGIFLVRAAVNRSFTLWKVEPKNTEEALETNPAI